MQFCSMKRPAKKTLFALLALPLAAQTPAQLEPHDVTLAAVTYLGRSAVQVIARPVPNGESYAILKESSFHNGTIEVDVAGKPAAGAPGDARGFIGLAFRLKNGKYEYVYLRPTNGRADDQVRRNHATQYSSHPDYDFARMRKEAPEKYESYADLETGAWTKFKLTVEGTKARLYLHNAIQPTLIVNDLKMGDAEGAVALWVGPGTEGYFSNLKITPSRP